MRTSSAVSASQWCTLDHVHGSACKPFMQGCSHDHSDERKLYEKPLEEKMKAIRLFREEGNQHFRVKDYELASASYRRALLNLDYTFDENDTDNEEIDAERLKCHLNLAAAKLEVLDYPEVVNQCRLALKMDPTNCKAHFRKGLAHLRRADLEEAQDHLYKAMKLSDSESRETRRPIEDAIRELNIKWRDYKKASAIVAKAALT